MKHLLFIGSLISVLVIGFLFARPIEASVVSSNLFPTITVLGVNVLSGGSLGSASKIVLADLSTSTSTTDYTLPSASSNDRVLYVIKTFGMSEPDHMLVIHPASGDNLDMDPYASTAIDPYEKGYAIFLGDAARDNWWLIGKGKN